MKIELHSTVIQNPLTEEETVLVGQLKPILDKMDSDLSYNGISNPIAVIERHSGGRIKEQTHGLQVWLKYRGHDLPRDGVKVQFRDSKGKYSLTSVAVRTVVNNHNNKLSVYRVIRY